MVRKVESGALRALASDVEEPFEVFFHLGQLVVHLEVGRGAIEAMHANALHFVDVDTTGQFCNKGPRGNGDEEVVPLDVHDAQDTVAVKRALSCVFLLVRHLRVYLA